MEERKGGKEGKNQGETMFILKKVSFLNVRLQALKPQHSNIKCLMEPLSLKRILKYTLNLNNVICQLYFNKAGRRGEEYLVEA